MSAARSRRQGRRPAAAGWLGGMLAFSLAAGSGAQTLPAESGQRHDESFAQAMALYDRNHWASAWRLLAELADSGHRDAAWLALQMWRHGPRLYGTDFELGPLRRERWLDLLEPARPARPEGHWEPGPYGC